MPDNTLEGIVALLIDEKMCIFCHSSIKILPNEGCKQAASCKHHPQLLHCLDWRDDMVTSSLSSLNKTNETINRKYTKKRQEHQFNQSTIQLMLWFNLKSHKLLKARKKLILNGDDSYKYSNSEHFENMIMETSIVIDKLTYW